MKKIKTIEVYATNRYWEDGQINGEPDEEGNMPFKYGDVWCPVIEAKTGIIKDWPKGITAQIHYKVVDQFSAKFIDKNGDTVLEIEDEYVPEFMYPSGNGYGDYIIMTINSNGKIENWEFSDDMVTNNIHEDE